MFCIRTKGICSLDFVLVWETSSQEEEMTTNGEGQASSNMETDRPEVKKTKLVKWRERFLRNLQAAGLLVEKVLPNQIRVSWLR